MGRRLQSIETRLLPHGRRDLLKQIALFMSAFALYDLVRGLGRDQHSYKPFGDAMRIIDFERASHVFIEPAVQAWTQRTHWLMDAANWTYLDGHFLVTLVALAFIYCRRNESYYFVRNMFLVAMALALIGYSVFPTAPPRLLPEWGFTDSISQFMGVPHFEDGPVKLFLNDYAAVPSMHVAFAVMLGSSMARLCQPLLVKLAWVLYPLVVTYVVVATANHFLVDVVLGAVTAGLAALLAHRLLARARPAVWAFTPATAY